jgi:hypothetical protein
MDGYSTMCKKAYSVCGHYNGSTITGSSPVRLARWKWGVEILPTPLVLLQKGSYICDYKIAEYETIL